MSDLNEIIEATTEAAGPSWKEQATEVVETLALTKREFTADDAWLAGLERPENSRALGGIFTRAKNNGLIEDTGRLVKSVFESGHFGPRRVWRSLVVVEDAVAA